MQLKLEPIRVAVEINENLIPRKTFAKTVLREGDRVEVVTLVGGG
jgi:sulfur carrier protein